MKLKKRYRWSIITGNRVIMLKGDKISEYDDSHWEMEGKCISTGRWYRDIIHKSYITKLENE